MNYQTRLEKVKQVMKASGCDAFLIDNPINIYYLTGLSLSAGNIIIKDEEAILLVDNRYFEFCKSKAPIPVLQSEKNPLNTVLDGVSKLAFDSETTTYQVFLNLEKLLKDVTLVPLNNPLQRIRAIKEPEEIAFLQEAAALGFQGYHYVESLLKDEISELEIAAELDIFWKRKGGKGLLLSRS